MRMNQPLSVSPSILGDRQAEPLDEPLAADRLVPDIVDYWRRIMARKWLLFAILAGFILAAVLRILLMTPIYVATATVMLEPTRNRIVSIEEVYTGASPTREFFTTQAEFIGSRNVTERVVRSLGLTDHPAFDPRQQVPSMLDRLTASLSGWLSHIGRALRGDDDGALSGDRPDVDPVGSVARQLREGLVIEPVRFSQLIKVHFASTDRVLAARVANAVVAAYIEADMDARYQVTQQAHAWLANRVNTLRENLAQSERVLQAYRDSRGLIDKGSAAQGGTVLQFGGLTERLVEARVRRSQAEQAYNQVRSTAPGVRESSPAVLAKPFVARARDSHIEAQRRMNDVAQRLGEFHPEYKAAQADLQAAVEAFRQAVATAAAVIIKEFESARAVEKAIEGELASSRQSIQAHNREEPQLAIYERDVAINRQLYETFLARAKETDIAGDIESPIARVIDDAKAPIVPSSPAKVLTLLVAILSGLLFGVAFVLLRYRLDTTFRSIDEIERTLQAPILTALPELTRRQSKVAHRMVVAEPDSGFSESIRTARTSIVLSTIDTPGRVIVITSALADEGKTTVAMNLARAQAQTKRTLLIEGDLRRPAYGNLLGATPLQKGLSDILAGEATAAECILSSEPWGLDVLVAGASSSTPLESLSSRRFEVLIEELRKHYDMIIVDTPPLSLVSDATIIANVATSTILVVRAGYTSRRLAARSLRKLMHSPASFLGIVVNRLDFKRARDYYGEADAYSAEGYGGYRPLRS